MNIGRLAVIIAIFFCISIAWAILGTSIVVRTNQGDSLLSPQVQDLWGSVHQQSAPVVTLTNQNGTQLPVELDSTTINVALDLNQRRKGLLWYATYGVAFDGTYTFSNPLKDTARIKVTYQFPSSGTIYDNFEFRVGDQLFTPNGTDYQGIDADVLVPAGRQVKVHVAYKSRGMDAWRYSFSDGITTVRNFSLTVKTNFSGFDFPAATISPTTKSPDPSGWTLKWEFNNLVSDFDLGVQMPTVLNPGPLASRMSFFAPLSLLFFFTVLIVLGAVRDQNLHPLHYFFLGASFFAFHLLFAYLVDHLVVEAAFAIAACVSLALVFSYLWRAAGLRFAAWAGLAQLLFLVLFSYAFFFEGFTGLVITIGAIITLAILMQITARVDWNEVFQRKERRAPAPKA